MRLSNVSCIDFVTRLEDANVERGGASSQAKTFWFLREHLRNDNNDDHKQVMASALCTLLNEWQNTG